MKKSILAAPHLGMTMETLSENSAAPDLETWLVHHTTIHKETLFSNGQTVGEWQLLALLGRGGSGEVWRARRLPSGEIAAVKFLHRTSPEARTRFLRECALLESIHLPGVSRFIAAGEANGIPFLATEELTDYVYPSSDDGVAELLLALIPALAALHRIGIIHRDIKPSNIMGRPGADGHLCPVLIDLGLLKQLTPEGLPATGTLSIVEGHAVGVGTPGYAAPEQFIGGDLSPATDIHALGMLANHCFNGTPPRAWISIIRRATTSIPSQRYATVMDLARAIRRRHNLRTAVRALGFAAALLVAGTISFALTRTLALRDIRQHDRIYVSAAAAAPGDGSKRHPFPTITAGIRAVNPSGTVIVGPGTYDEHLVINSKPVSLLAPAGFEKTIVRGHFGAATISVSDQGTDSAITGFTFTGGGGIGRPGAISRRSWEYEFIGGGAFCATEARFYSCRFMGNGNRTATNQVQRTSTGGGVIAFFARVMLTDCLVTNNYAEILGGGLLACGSNACLTVQGGAIVDNDVGQKIPHGLNRIGGIVIMQNATATINKATIARNGGEQLGAPYGSNMTTLTIIGCSVEGGARANGITQFISDYKSREDYRP